MDKTIVILVSVFAIALVANLALLNYTTFKLIPKRLESIRVDSPAIPVISDSRKTEDSCGTACQQALQFALKQVDQKIATLTSKISSSSALKPSPSSLPLAKESFIPMGTGSTTKSEWEDIAGSDVYINTDNFSTIRETFFEVSMHIPTKNGVVFARLYNVTDKHPVWYSDVSTDQDISTFRSSKIKLDTGNKQYRIQMKTSLQYQSYVDTARIKIISQ